MEEDEKRRKRNAKKGVGDYRRDTGLHLAKTLDRSP